MTLRGIRGATTADSNRLESIMEATQELLSSIQAENNSLFPEDIASIFFTVTEDLDAGYPAIAAREMGWVAVPLLCAREIPVPGSIKLCIRVLIHWNTDLAQSDIKHVYLKAATSLRPDLFAAEQLTWSNNQRKAARL
jgi:chorismate mutase